MVHGRREKQSFFFLEILEFIGREREREREREKKNSTDNAFSLDSGLHAWLANWAIDRLVVYAL
jgi:hypothetical protein